jgi:hypothetical protein
MGHSNVGVVGVISRYFSTIVYVMCGFGIDKNF